MPYHHKKTVDMKNLMMLLLMSIPMLGYAQWNGVYFHADYESAFQVLNKDTIIAVTYGDGRIHRTANGGQSWSFYQTEFTTSWFLDIDFPTNTIGYACGGTAYGNHTNIIAKTTNGGQTWDSLTSNAFSGYSFTKIHFLNPDTGFVAQEGNSILATLDGGATFNILTLEGTATDIVSKPNRELFVALRKRIDINTNAYYIAKSTDLGNTWTLVYSDLMANTNGINHREINKLFFVDNNLGYAVGGNGLFLKTTDGGTTWSTSFVSPYSNLTGLYFVSSNVGYINNAGGIYRTDDGGINWIVQNITPLEIINDIQFADETTGYALGQNGIFKTSNGGQIVKVNEPDYLTQFTSYPSPANDKIFITPWDNSINSVVIFNQTGQKVMQFEAKNELDISSLSKGVYFLLIKADKYQTAKQFMKK